MIIQDSILVTNNIKKTLPAINHSNKTELAIIPQNTSAPVDIIELTNQQVEFDNKSFSEKKPRRKKALIAAGITVATIIAGAAIAFLSKNSNKIANDLPKRLAKIDDFEVFKDLKMCNGLSLEEKVQAHKILMQRDNKNIFLATLTGNKPMALLSDVKRPYELDDTCFDVIKKLNLGKEFEVIDAHHFNINGFRNWNKYFINKKELIKTIEKNKDIYINSLNLPQNTSCKNIYEAISQHTKNNNGYIPDDILGISLGFPKYDSMIFHLEGLFSLRGERCSADYIEKILTKLKSTDSPYKNLKPERFKSLENAIKNISNEHLVEIGQKGSYCDDVYAFINFCNDTEELSRIANSTKSYKLLMGN